MNKINRKGIKDMILKQLQAQGRMMPQPRNSLELVKNVADMFAEEIEGSFGGLSTSEAAEEMVRVLIEDEGIKNPELYLAEIVLSNLVKNNNHFPEDSSEEDTDYED